MLRRAQHACSAWVAPDVSRTSRPRRLLLPAAGFLALIWFLIRVVPKPSRATYPCQRAAAPLAASFLVWLTGIAGAGFAFRQAQAKLRQARYTAAGLALVVAVAGLAWAVLSAGGPVEAVPVAYTAHPANAPLGVAQGLMPGRVAWAHNPGVTNWDGATTAVGQRWFDKIDQDEATELMQWALMGYAGTMTTADAWDAIFRHFNGGADYRAGEKIFIKINLTTSNADSCADASYNWQPSYCGASWTSVGQSPQLMIALLDQLVNVMGVAQADITIGDSTGLWVNELYNPLHTQFPNVVYLDARGGSGRTKAVRSTTPLYWSAPASETAGKSQDYLLQAVVDAKYMINFAVLKSHTRAGITVTAKNHFGSLSGGNNNVRKPTTANYYNLHDRLPLESDSSTRFSGRALMAQYRPLVDLNGHTGMGGKTLLYLLDAIYTGKDWNGMPSKWGVPPFCTTPECGVNDKAWPASLFLSMDSVAIDSVGFDLLSLRAADWPEVLAAEGVQDYLHESALADDPPSGTDYNPEHDTVPMASQGVHEHWNNATLKQYTRNLGSGDGIDLLYVTGDPNQDAAAHKLDRPIVIDEAADLAWNGASPYALDHILAGEATISNSDDLSANFRTLYDGAALYLFAEVTDDTLVNDSTSWTADDCVVILIDGDYSRGASYDGANDFELGICWNDATITAGANSAPVPAGADFEIAPTDRGYRLEVMLPLAELGITPGYGRLFGLDVQVCDDDDGGIRDAKIAWWATVDTSSQHPNAFGAGRLEGPQKVDATATAQEGDVLLQWTRFAWNDGCEVHRSTSPYFTPDETTRVATINPPASEYLDTSGSSRYYVIRAVEAGFGVNSNRTGRFQFDLTGG